MSLLSALAQDSYYLVGSARSGSTADCYQLTPSRDGQTGAVWFDKQLQLTASFELIFSLNFGENMYGADGMAMLFQTQGKQILGGAGRGLGYKDIRPSLGIEFDTAYNSEEGDIIEDHMALVSNGVTDHRLNTNFASPVFISPATGNVKDGRDHLVKVSWDATSQTLLVEVDCIVRIKQTINLVDTIFAGVSTVYWGFTASTGSANNTQTVCVQNRTEISHQIQACRNDLVTLTAPLSSNGQYSWSPITGLDNPQSRTPRLSVGNSQLYVVKYVKNCNQPAVDSVFVKAKNLGFTIGPDQQVCENDLVTLTPTPVPAGVPVLYRWSTGQHTPELKPTISGAYSLTATADGCSSVDSTTVTFNPLPTLNLSADSVYDCSLGQSRELNPQATGSGLKYVWSPGGGTNPTLKADLPGLYTVRISTDKGCSVNKRFVIRDNCQSALVFVPDAFTPNGDGINDLLKWQGDGTANASMKVFDRWGELLFVSTTSSPFWDGTYLGKPCPPAAYTWSLEYGNRLVAGTPDFEHKKQGRVLLVK